MNNLVIYFSFIFALLVRIECDQVLGFRCPHEDIKDGCKGPSYCLYPNPTNSTSFIQCTIAGLSYVKQCPSHLEWNNNRKICDHPQLSTCIEKSPHTSPHKPPKWHPKFVCPTRDIKRTGCKGPKDCLYTNFRNCNTFIQCTVNADNRTGRPVLRFCPSGLKWNDKSKICDWPYLATCRSN